MWNILIFFRDEANAKVVETFNPIPKDPELGIVPGVSDKTPCYVCLYSYRNGVVEIDEPFLSHFFDPRVYANHMLDSQFMGVMTKASPFGKALIDSVHLMMVKAVLVGGQKAFDELMKRSLT